MLNGASAMSLEQAVPLIERDYAAGMTVMQLVAKYNISVYLVREIVRK
jgi:Mor family transcriptional regulator